MKKPESTPNRPGLGSGIALLALLSALLVGCGPQDPGGDSSAPPPTTSEQDRQAAELVDSYVEHYLAHYPSTATAAGHHASDRFLEDFSAEKLEAWADFNRRSAEQLHTLIGNSAAPLSTPSRLDVEAVLRTAERELFELEVLDRPGTDPLMWTRLLATTPVFLLVRDDLPLESRLASLAERMEAVPRLADQARAALSDAERISAEIAIMADRQARASATFLEQGPALAADAIEDPATRDSIATRLRQHGRASAEALTRLADHLALLAATGSGSPRLGEHYAQSFRLGTGIEQPIDELLARAERDLEAKRSEAAAFCRQHRQLLLPDLLPAETATSDDDSRAADARDVRACFARIAEDGAESIDAFVEHYERLTLEAEAFLRQQQIVTLPGELTLVVDRSPSYFVGQAVGGVYPAGPFAPEADTLLFVPTPPESAPAEAKAAFFRDFNDHFNVMITPHETLPGHYLQLKTAALGSPAVRSLFSNGVYTEGWGTFTERLMLDRGWGDELARVAHLKKQLENIARTIVDIRVHTGTMDRQEVLRFVRDEALQDEQFAANMWSRAITSSPQLTTYYLGYRQIWDLYQEAREEQGEAFDLRRFMDGMLSLGAVPVNEYRSVVLGAEAS